MSGKSSLLCFAVGMMAETSLLLQISDECPYLSSAYLSNIGAQTVTAEELVKVGYAIGDNGYCIFALAFSLGARRVAWRET